MKVKRIEPTKITIPSEFFTDEENYWIEVAPLNSYQLAKLRLVFIGDITNQDLQNQNLKINKEALALKDHYLLAIAIKNTNIIKNWIDIDYEDRCKWILKIEELNSDLFNWLVKVVKEVIGDVI